MVLHLIIKLDYNIRKIDTNYIFINFFIADSNFSKKSEMRQAVRSSTDLYLCQVVRNKLFLFFLLFEGSCLLLDVGALYKYLFISAT